MSDLFDDDPRATPPRSRPRRSRALLITAVVLVALIFALTGFASIYTDRLWYQSVGFGSVFSRLLWTRISMFVVFGALLGGVVALCVFLAYRARPLIRPTSREQTSLDRYRDVVTPIRTWLVVGIALVFGAFAGASGMSHWRTFMLWRHGPSVDQTDPYFGRDFGFYLFDLPWWHFLVDFTMATLVIGVLASVVTHYLFGGVRLQSGQDRFSSAAQVQLSVLVGLFVLVKGVDYYLDRFDLVTQQNPRFTGMNYTGENAVLPAKNILMVVAVICAVLFFVNVWRRTWQLPSVGLALLALSAVLIGMIFPAVVQQFQVKPSEADREEPYIQASIDATRSAYDLSDSQSLTIGSDAVDDVGSFGQFVASVPVVDPQLVSRAFGNLQLSNDYYSVPDVLDVDRYPVDGNDRAIVLGVRELNQQGLPDESRNWSNLHTVYTHGNGIIAAYGNQRTAENTESTDVSEDDLDSERLEWAQGISAGQDDLTRAVGEFESRIYYGEQSPDYSVVGVPDGSDPVELNLPVPGSSLGDNTTFDGPGDASVGGFFNQLMFAVKFGEPNFLLSGRVNSTSKVLYDREPTDRVEKVAPWLTVDSDSYPTVVDGRILWVVDGYTTTDRFPNAQKSSFQDMIDDSQQQQTGIQTLPTDEINYMRNAIKATVDAYSGEVTLYEWDTDDPILEAWMGAFPGTVTPEEDIPDELRAHLRYPEDLFKVQRYQLARYHVTDASDYFEGNGRWEVADDPQITGVYQAPYRTFVQGESGSAADPSASAFSLSSVYTPYQRENLAAFVTVDSDATSEDYGLMRTIEVQGANEDGESAVAQISGPGQVANEFQSDNDVRTELLEFVNSDADVTYGNLLTFPLGEGLMSVQPVYVARSVGDSSYPVLARVMVKVGDDVGIDTTLSRAVRNLSPSTGDPDDGGEDPPVTPTPSTTSPPTSGPPTSEPPTNPGSIQQQIDAQLEAASDAFAAADAALAAGNLAGYQRQVDIARDALNAAIALQQQRDAGTTTASASGG